MIDDEGLGLSVPEIEINGAQIAAARRAIEKSKTQAEIADDAEIKLQRLLNPARAVTDETPNTRPCVTEEQVRRALVHREDNFMNRQAVMEVMKSIIRLDSLEVFANQQMYESGDTLPDELPLTISKKKDQSYNARVE
jgi:cellobiose-specific phosphotransferase system component IIA